MNDIKVAIVGAGPAGLAALRLLNHDPNNNFKATAFEMTSHVGGTWFYTDNTDKDENGLPVHSSMYRSLRTNLPKEIMGFPDFAFSSHLPSFMKRQDVHKYLEDYASHFDLWKDIKFKTIVKNVKPIPDEYYRFGVKWQVNTADAVNPSEVETQIFDAVLVCTGHYANPSMPTTIPGLDTFEGDLIHSHHYREPSTYTNKKVVVLGAKSSGQDISLEVARIASQVYLSHNNYPNLSTFLPSNICQKPGIRCCHKTSVEFNDGSTLEVDAIILCTGYLYKFPSLDESCGINVDNNFVLPLYKHLFSVDYPSLGLIGLMHMNLAFLSFYMQIKCFRSVMGGTSTLPSKKEMMDEINEEITLLTNKGKPKRYFYYLIGERQFEYYQQLADFGKFEYDTPDVISTIFDMSYMLRMTSIVTFRSLNFEVAGNGKDVIVTAGEGKSKITLDRDNLIDSYKSWWKDVV